MEHNNTWKMRHRNDAEIKERRIMTLTIPHATDQWGGGGRVWDVAGKKGTPIAQSNRILNRRDKKLLKKGTQ